MSRKSLKPSRNVIWSKEESATVRGVEGRFMNRIFDEANGLFSSQTFIATRSYTEDGYKRGSRITMEVRFDDNCRNGYQNFAITGHVQEPGKRDWATGGCIHEDIAKYFPEFAPLIKWHGMGTASPMHYVANTVYHASNRANGYAAGEPCAWDRRIRFAAFPITHKISKRFSEWLDANRTEAIVPVAVEHDKKPGDTYVFDPKYTFNGYECKWHECPFDTLSEAQEWAKALELGFTFEMIPTEYSKGKERDLDAARSAGVWPDATDAELCAEPEVLEAALLARLPALVAEFRADMESIGMLWRELSA